jgi:hypothetical protein
MKKEPLLFVFILAAFICFLLGHYGVLSPFVYVFFACGLTIYFLPVRLIREILSGLKGVRRSYLPCGRIIFTDAPGGVRRVGCDTGQCFY